MPALTLAAAAVLSAGQADDPYNYPIEVPRLESAAAIDGNLSEWRDHAFSDGVWDIARIAKSPWYDPARNRLAWQNWSAKVSFPQAGYYEIWARATDDNGVMQPMVVPGWNPRGYLNNACHRVAVKVVS